MSTNEKSTQENIESEAARRVLFGLAYRMLGTHAEAEDAIQDAYLRWYASDRTLIASPIAWLRTTLARLCVDRLRAAKRHRRRYVGP